METKFDLTLLNPIFKSIVEAAAIMNKQLELIAHHDQEAADKLRAFVIEKLQTQNTGTDGK